VTRTNPDLLDKREMAETFRDARLLQEKCFGLTKSLMAVRSASS
jgi:hypothetical protein